jgi:adenylosuccinate synthase
MIKAVIGLGFGDEGKGCTVNWLASRYPDATVVRYSGGHQAGHHVKHLPSEKEHIFSNYGSGTLAGLKTYWSKHCVVDPVGLYVEAQVLKEKGIHPQIIINKKTPMCTPYEKAYNDRDERTKRNGTCGQGLYATMLREKHMHSILAGDINHKVALDIKMKLLAKTHPMHAVSPRELREFEVACHWMSNCAEVTLVNRWEATDDIIFEGSQGLLLDQSMGFFPHCTPSDVGSKGIAKVENMENVSRYYVTRGYQTRHGAGPMTKHISNLEVTGNWDKTNPYNDQQGLMRWEVLDLDLLAYALDQDGFECNHHDTLVVTCLEHMSCYTYWYKGSIVMCETAEEFCHEIASQLGFVRVVICTDHKFEGL